MIKKKKVKESSHEELIADFSQGVAELTSQPNNVMKGMVELYGNSWYWIGNGIGSMVSCIKATLAWQVGITIIMYTYCQLLWLIVIYLPFTYGSRQVWKINTNGIPTHGTFNRENDD